MQKYTKSYREIIDEYLFEKDGGAAAMAAECVEIMPEHTALIQMMLKEGEEKPGIKPVDALVSAVKHIVSRLEELVGRDVAVSGSAADARRAVILLDEAVRFLNNRLLSIILQEDQEEK